LRQSLVLLPAGLKNRLGSVRAASLTLTEMQHRIGVSGVSRPCKKMNRTQK
jgi:hypothetical protein